MYLPHSVLGSESFLFLILTHNNKTAIKLGRIKTFVDENSE